MIPKLMKAAVLTAPKTFEIRQVPVPPTATTRY